MAFGKEKTQPQNTNHCGGYALWAILVDSGKVLEEKVAPEEIHDAVQKLQKRGGEVATKCLPSSLMKEAKIRGFEVSLHYHEGLAFAPEVMEDVEMRCEGKVNLCTSKEEVLKVFGDDDQQYYLVLVNDCRWIATKRKKKEENANKFSVYDSVGGSHFELLQEDACAGEFPDKYDNVGSLVIALRLP